MGRHIYQMHWLDQEIVKWQKRSVAMQDRAANQKINTLIVQPSKDSLRTPLPPDDPRMVVPPRGPRQEKCQANYARRQLQRQYTQ